MNKPALLIGGGVVVITIMGGLFIGSSKTGTAPGYQKRSAYDVPDGDTNNEVMRDLIAQNKEIRQQLKSSESARKQAIKEQDAKSTEQYNDAVSKFKTMLTASQDKLSHALGNIQKSDALSKIKRTEHPSGSKYDVGGGEGSTTNRIGLVQDASSQFAAKKGENGQASPTNMAPILPSDRRNLGPENRPLAKPKPIPFLTLPALSTMTGVNLLTSIIAEVPVNGSLLAPAWPWKAVVSRKYMFSANNQPLPADIVGAVIGGYSVGNMTMSCANVYATQILFVFKDGHYEVFPKPGKNGGGNNADATNVYPKNALGYLSTPFGNTCIGGKYYTDAPKVIANLMAFGAAKGVGSAIAQQQTSVQQNAIQSVSQVTGSLAKYAGGLAISGGADSAEKWYLDHYGGTFDVVFVPSSKNNKPTSLVFNLSRTIKIDYNKEGRKLKNEKFETLSSSDANLS